ncbi:MAG: hypothetical protein MJZ95_00230 [Paludibacteraceae bacterium]|nr:hypothetical protein [Paludibacteraceae bacterium]
MRKLIFAVMVFAVAAMLVGCSKDEKKSEVAITISEVTDSTAIVKCEYSPAKSASYKLQLGEAVSMGYSKSMKFVAACLNGGTKYNVVATSYDADHKQVGTTTVNFRTTGTPNNNMRKEILKPIEKDATETDN